MSDKNEIKFSVSIDPREAIREAKELASKISKATKANVKDTGLENQQDALKKINQEASKRIGTLDDEKVVEERINQSLKDRITLQEKVAQLKDLLAKRAEKNAILEQKEANYADRHAGQPNTKRAIIAQTAIDTLRSEVSGFDSQIATTKSDIDSLTYSISKTDAYLEDMNNRATAFNSTFGGSVADADLILNSVNGVATAEEKAAEGASDLEQIAKNVADTFGEVENNVEDVGTKAEETSEALKDAVEGLSTARIDTKADLSYQPLLSLLNYIRQAKLEMAELRAIESPTPENIARYDELRGALLRAYNQLNLYKAGTTQAAQAMSTIDQAIQGFANADGLLSGILNVIKAIGPAAQQAGLISKFALAEATAGLSLVITVISQVVNAIQTIGNVLQSIWIKAKQVFSSIYNAIKKVIETVSELISKIRDGLRNALDKISGSADKAFSSRNLKHTLQMLTKYIFGVRSFFFLYRKLRSAVTEGLKSLVQYESATNETNHAITELRSSLLYLRNAWAAAFAPIINYVYPILVKFMDLLASVGNAIARFIAAITGQATVLQAVKVDAGDYADSLKDAAGGASKAAKAQEDLNDRLAAFDDLNVLGVDDDKTKTPSGGGGGGLGDDIDPNTMFERVKVKMDSLMQKIREAWQTGDAFELGQIFAESLSNSLDKVHEWLTGEGRNKILKIANLIATFTDGVLSNGELATKIGQVLADAFNLGFDFVNTIITPNRMYMIGLRIAQALNTAIPQIVPKIGETLGNLFKSAISGMWGFISTADFAEWGKSFGDAINNFLQQMSGSGGEGGKGTLSGWKLLGMSVTEWAKQILDFFISAIEKVNWSEIGVAIRDFLESIDWGAIKEKLRVLWEDVWKALGDVFPEGSEFFNSIKGIFEGVFGIIRKAVESLANIDWTPITDGISTLVDRIAKADWNGIGSAISSLITTLGDNLPGIVNFISDISDKFGELMDDISAFIASDDFVLMVISIREEFERTATAIENIVGLASSIQGFFDTIRGGGEEDFGFFKLLKLLANIGLSGVSDQFAPIINGVISFRNMFANFDKEIDGFTNFVNSISDKLDELGINFGTVKDVLIGIWDLMSGGFNQLIQDFILGQVDLSDVFDDISESFDTWEEIKDTFTDIAIAIAEKVSDLVLAFLSIPDSLSNLPGLFRNIFNQIISLMNDFFSSIVEGRNTLVSTLSSMGGLSGAALAFASSGTISYTPIPPLAQGAVLPPNKPFLAMVGDQSNGTNIEAPLDTIRQAVGEEFAPYFEQMINATLQVVQAVNSKNLVIGDREIGKANARYVNQQKMIKGTML